jgi:hypothetical protein
MTVFVIQTVTTEMKFWRPPVGFLFSLEVHRSPFLKASLRAGPVHIKKPQHSWRFLEGQSLKRKRKPQDTFGQFLIPATHSCASAPHHLSPLVVFLLTLWEQITLSRRLWKDLCHTWKMGFHSRPGPLPEATLTVREMNTVLSSLQAPKHKGQEGTDISLDKNEVIRSISNKLNPPGPVGWRITQCLHWLGQFGSVPATQGGHKWLHINEASAL